MKFYVDEKWVYYVKECLNSDSNTEYILHKTQLDSYGFFNTANGIPIRDIFVESNNMNDFNNLKRLQDLLMPKSQLSQDSIQLTLF